MFGKNKLKVVSFTFYFRHYISIIINDIELKIDLTFSQIIFYQQNDSD